jgi:hypothetical protein
MLAAMKRLAVALLVACHHGAAPAPATTATCEQVGDHLITFVANGPKDEIAAIRGVLVERCTADSWSADARSCIVVMQTPDDVRHCKTLLTQEQRDAADKAGIELLHKLHPETDKGPTGEAPPPPAETPKPPPPPMSPPPPRGGKDKPKGGGSGRNSGDPCEGGQ